MMFLYSVKSIYCLIEYYCLPLPTLQVLWLTEELFTDPAISCFSEDQIDLSLTECMQYLFLRWPS